MAGSVNRAILVGNIGKDPDIRTTQAGAKIVNLSVATSEQWTDKASGEKKQRVEWHKVCVFNDRAADFAEKYVRKGSKVYVEGEIQTRKYTDQSGAERYSTEIVLNKFKGELILLSDGAARTEGSSPPAASNTASEGRPIPGTNKRVYDIDDEIPF